MLKNICLNACENGFSTEFAQKVSSCIKVHRFRSSNPPTNIEEKILFDSDKIDATGTLGIARTIFYKGKVGEPLYSISKTGEVSDGSNDMSPSFFQLSTISIRQWTGPLKFNCYLSANTGVCQGYIRLFPEILLDCSHERVVWPTSQSISKSVFCRQEDKSMPY